MLATVARSSLARNSALIMASTVGTSGLGYLFWMVAARELPPPAIGTATALISVATVVSMVSNLGIGHMFIQRLPTAGADAWSRTVSAGLLVGCAATALAAAGAVVLLPRTAGTFAFLTGPGGAAALVATAVALTASTLLDNVFVAHRASHGMLGRNLALAVGKVLALSGLTLSGLTLSGLTLSGLTLSGLTVAGPTVAGLATPAAVLLAWTVPSVAVTAYTLRISLPRLRAGSHLRVAGIRAELRHIRASLTGHHPVNLAQAGPSALLPVLVTARLGAGETAHFYVAWMTASVLFMVSPAVASALYAERSNAAGRSASLPRAALVVLVVIGGPAVVLFLGGGVILGLFSPGYASGGAVLLKILVLAAIPDAITNLAVAHWRSIGELRRCLWLNLLMAAACLTLTWLWLPTVGVEAAGLAWLAGQSAGALLVAGHALRSRFGRRAPIGPSLWERLSRRPGTPAGGSLWRRFSLRQRLSRRAPLAVRPLPRGAGRSRPAVRLDRPTRPSPRSRPRSRSWRVP